MKSACKRGLRRGKNPQVKKNTLNKDIRNIGAFLNRAIKNRYVTPEQEIKKVKVAQKPVQVLSPQQVMALIADEHLLSHTWKDSGPEQGDHQAGDGNHGRDDRPRS